MHLISMSSSGAPSACTWHSVLASSNRPPYDAAPHLAGHADRGVHVGDEQRLVDDVGQRRTERLERALDPA